MAVIQALSTPAEIVTWRTEVGTENPPSPQFCSNFLAQVQHFKFAPMETIGKGVCTEANLKGFCLVNQMPTHRIHPQRKRRAALSSSPPTL